MKRHIKNLVDEVHKKTVLWLTQTFDITVLPKYNSKQMFQRQKRKINIEEFGKIVITTVSEAYTSKTCSHCEYIKSNLGGNKVFKFNKFELQINRAWGIFLQALLDGCKMHVKCKQNRQQRKEVMVTVTTAISTETSTASITSLC
ncbi:hypothetical protein Glove_241g11 [Diversispora epigaea]|uniref:Cas12f1-like TNB domain-containing protein n=1 Tax=Diversispora epigaea TaxID=1348612 RepID=A0A397IH84_9GLOM|nr:hypothetical protein Glove_241g11 [Diversispora epigaea]